MKNRVLYFAASRSTVGPTLFLVHRRMAISNEDSSLLDTNEYRSPMHFC